MGEAFVLVHGFAGDRSSMELLKEHFEIRGNFVYSVQLSGHGTVWEDLKSVSRFEWYRDVQEAGRPQILVPYISLVYPWEVRCRFMRQV